LGSQSVVQRRSPLASSAQTPPGTERQSVSRAHSAQNCRGTQSLCSPPVVPATASQKKPVGQSRSSLQSLEQKLSVSPIPAPTHTKPLD
jgi:hypothetical protein